MGFVARIRDRVGARHRILRLAMKFERCGVDPYDSTVDPYELVRVSPNDIDRFSYRIRPGDTRRVEAALGDVRAGNWDTNQRDISPHVPDRLSEVLISDQFEETGLYRSFEERYDAGVPWRETEYYAAIVDSVAEFAWHGCSTRGDVDRWMEHIDDLFADIRENGYRAYTEMSGCRCKKCLSNEIVVDVGGDGELLFVAGRHRLAIAKILDLDEIPVVVAVRHHDHVASGRS